MKTIQQLRIIVCLAMAGNFVAPGFAVEPAKTGAKVSWKVAGELEEACSCNPACPC